jgi:hypothetical protein
VWLTAAIVVCAAVCLASAVGVYSLARYAAGGNGSSSAANNPAPSPTVEWTPFSGDLRTLLVSPPAGSSPWATPASTDGTLTLDQAAGLFKDKNQALTNLPALGFKQGAIVQWTSDTEDVEIRLYQLGDPISAQRLASGVIAADMNDPQRENLGGIAVIPGAELFEIPTPNAQGHRAIFGTFAQHDIFVNLRIYQTNPDVAAAEQLAISQFNRLP